MVDDDKFLRHRWISRRVWWLRRRALIWFQKLVNLVRLIFQNRLLRLVLYLLATILVLRTVMLRFTKNWSIEVYTMPEDRLSGVPKRYAICFHGSHTSLKHVLPSIKCNVFKPITDAGDTYDVFVHTFHDDIPGEDRHQQLSANETIVHLKPVR